MCRQAPCLIHVKKLTIQDKIFNLYVWIPEMKRINMSTTGNKKYWK